MIEIKNQNVDIEDSEDSEATPVREGGRARKCRHRPEGVAAGVEHLLSLSKQLFCRYVTYSVFLPQREPKDAFLLQVVHSCLMTWIN